MDTYASYFPMLTSAENHKPGQKFPEKIIFVVDTGHEAMSTTFQLRTGAKCSSFYVIKRVVEIFFHNKLMLDQQHEFALVILGSQKAHWLCNFTGNFKTLLNALESIEESPINVDQKYFDLQQVFELVHEHVRHETTLQTNVMRIILLYSRSHAIPRFNITETSTQELIRNPNFFLDILYFHDPSTLRNKCEEIYAELNKLDIKNISYIMEVSRNAAKAHNYMARLLAHPIQRVPQKDMKYCVHSSIRDVQENKIES